MLGSIGMVSNQKANRCEQPLSNNNSCTRHDLGRWNIDEHSALAEYEKNTVEWLAGDCPASASSIYSSQSCKQLQNIFKDLQAMSCKSKGLRRAR